MFLAEDIWDEAETIFGHCAEGKLLRNVSDSVELLANKGEIDPLVGWVDICVSNKCFSLPQEVETLLALNINGHPALGKDEVFQFHLNGPGDFRETCDYSWTNEGTACTYRDLATPSKIIAFLDSPDDANKKFRVFGYDKNNRPLRTEIDGVLVDGYLVPTIWGFALPDAGASQIGLITGIVKDQFTAGVRLTSFDGSNFTGTTLGYYEANDVTPLFRRVKLSRSASWVRIKYRKKTARLFTKKDRILLHSRPALIMAMHALRHYRDGSAAEGLQFESIATRLLTERQSVLLDPNPSPIQVDDRLNRVDKIGYADDIR